MARVCAASTYYFYSYASQCNTYRALVADVFSSFYSPRASDEPYRRPNSAHALHPPRPPLTPAVHSPAVPVGPSLVIYHGLGVMAVPHARQQPLQK